LWVVFNNNVNNFVAIERLTVGSPVEVAGRLKRMMSTLKLLEDLPIKNGRNYSLLYGSPSGFFF
jgi:hypothetical protein